MATPWLLVYLRQGKYVLPCTSLPDARGMRQEVGPVTTAPEGDLLALAEALEWSYRRSEKRRRDMGVRDHDPGPAGRSLGLRTQREFFAGLKVVGVEFLERKVHVAGLRLVRKREPFSLVMGEGELASRSGEIDFVALSRSVMATLEGARPLL